MSHCRIRILSILVVMLLFLYMGGVLHVWVGVASFSGIGARSLNAIFSLFTNKALRVDISFSLFVSYCPSE